MIRGKVREDWRRGEEEEKKKETEKENYGRVL